MAAHRSFVKKYFDKNTFVLVGRKKPRTGGIILAYADSKELIMNLIKEDPFYIHNLVDYEITEFVPMFYNSYFVNSAVFSEE